MNRPSLLISILLTLSATLFSRDAYHVVDDDVVRACFNDYGGQLFSVLIPSAFNNDHAHSKIFGGGGFPPVATLKSQSQRVDIYEQVIRHLVFQPQSAEVMNWDARLQELADAAASVGEPMETHVFDSLLLCMKALHGLGTISTGAEVLGQIEAAHELAAAAHVGSVFSKLTDASAYLNQNPAMKALGPLLALTDALNTVDEVKALSLLYLGLATSAANERLNVLRNLNPLVGDDAAWTSAWNRVNNAFSGVSDGRSWAALVLAMNDTFDDKIFESIITLQAVLLKAIVANPVGALVLVSAHAIKVYGQIYNFNDQLQYATVAATVYDQLRRDADPASNVWIELTQHAQFIFYDSLAESLRQT